MFAYIFFKGGNLLCLPDEENMEIEEKLHENEEMVSASQNSEIVLFVR